MSGMVVQIGADVKGAIKGIEDVSLSLKEQKAILASLQRQYAQLNTSQARGAIGKDLAADIRVAKDEISRLGAVSTNTFGKIGGAATKGLSAVRNLAYVLPGIGLAGIFSAAFSGIELVVQSLINAENSTKNLANAMSAAKGKFVEATSTVFELRTNIDLAKKGFISKDGVVKMYNETIGKTTGFVSNLNEAEQALNRNADAYIQFTFKKAVANLALAKAAEVAFEQEKFRFDHPLSKTGLGLLGPSGQSFQQIQDRQIRDMAEKRMQKQLSDLQSIGKASEAEAAAIAKAFGFNFFPESQKGGSKIDNFIPKFPTVKAAIPLEFTIDQKRLKFILLGGELKTFKEQVEDNINKGIEKLVVAPKISQSKRNIADVKDIGIATADAFNSGLNSAVTSGISSLAAGLGEALAGGDIKSAFAAFGQTIGAGLQAIGEQIIAIGVAAVLAKEALKKLFENPFIAIAAGLALVAAGAAFKSVMGKGLSGRAAGGPVGAGQPYMVGEVGREIFVPSTSGRIIPNNQSGSFAGGANPVVIFNGRLAVSGNELKLLLNRTDKYQGRNV